jgi:hypothetical protein
MQQYNTTNFISPRNKNIEGYQDQTLRDQNIHTYTSSIKTCVIQKRPTQKYLSEDYCSDTIL